MVKAIDGDWDWALESLLVDIFFILLVLLIGLI